MDEPKNRRTDQQGPKTPLRWGERWTLLLTSPTSGIVGQYGATWPGQPAHYERVNVYAEGAAKLDDIEQYRLQMAAIGTASFGYWKEGDNIHPDYDTVPLRDVARLFAKYDHLYKFREQVRVMVAMLKNREWAEDLAATGDAAELQAVITELVGQVWTKARVQELAKSIAEATAKNASTVPQLTFPHIYLGLLEALVPAHSTGKQQEASEKMATLTTEEQAFVELVRQRPGHKLNSGEARGTDGASLWERPQALGLIQAVGSYKWVVPGAQAQNPVADAVDAALHDAVVHGTGAFQVKADGSTEHVVLSKEDQRHYAELAAFPPKLQRDALYQDYAVPTKEDPT